MIMNRGKPCRRKRRSVLRRQRFQLGDELSVYLPQLLGRISLLFVVMTTPGWIEAILLVQASAGGRVGSQRYLLLPQNRAAGTSDDVPLRRMRRLLDVVDRDPWLRTAPRPRLHQRSDEPRQKRRALIATFTRNYSASRKKAPLFISRINPRENFRQLLQEPRFYSAFQLFVLNNVSNNSLLIFVSLCIHTIAHSEGLRMFSYVKLHWTLMYVPFHHYFVDGVNCYFNLLFCAIVFYISISILLYFSLLFHGFVPAIELNKNVHRITVQSKKGSSWHQG